MVDRDLIKAEIDQVEETYLELLYRIIKTMTPAETSKAEQLPPHLRQRQIQLVSQAHQLRAHLGDPINGLIELLSGPCHMKVDAFGKNRSTLKMVDKPKAETF